MRFVVDKYKVLVAEYRQMTVSWSFREPLTKAENEQSSLAGLHPSRPWVPLKKKD